MTSKKEQVLPKRIRDFLYVDVPRLRSLYAQVFEQVTEEIIRERISEELTSEMNSLIEKDETSQRERGGTRAVKRAEYGVLHDHMYNELETELSQIIGDTSEITDIETLRSVCNQPFIRVSGQMEIEDYERLKLFIDKFNTLGEAIAYSRLYSEQSQSTTPVTRNSTPTASNNSGGGKRKAQQKSTSTDVQALAQQLGMYQSPKVLENIKLYVDLFEDHAYHVVIAADPNSYIRYRGVLDRTLLRLEPWQPRSLFGNQSSAQWTMVGTVTYFPRSFRAWSSSKKASSEIATNNKPEFSMLDPLRNTMRATRELERAFLESLDNFEVVLLPLAIYRDFEIRNTSPRNLQE